MLALVKNELIKLFYRKKIFIAMLIIIASAIVGVWGSIAYIKSVQPEEEIRSLQKTISQLQKEKSKIKDEVKKQKIDMQIYQLEQQLAQLKSALASDSNNWRENLKKEIKELKIKMNQALDLSFSDSRENYRKEIIENEYYLLHNLKPLKRTDLNNFSVMILFLGYDNIYDAFNSICDKFRYNVKRIFTEDYKDISLTTNTKKQHCFVKIFNSFNC